MPPGEPSRLAGQIDGSTVTLSWVAPGSGGLPTSYVVEAGSAPALANLANISTGGTATVFTATGVAAGTYYTRVRATNAIGTSGASNEILLYVGCTLPPSAPLNLRIVSQIGRQVALDWTRHLVLRSYVLEVGSGPGLSEFLGTTDLHNAATAFVTSGVGNGAYYARVRAKFACGLSEASREIVVSVGDLTWVPTGSMQSWRYAHTATLLPNGIVLVAGGLDGRALASAETYDEATGTWTATGSLTTARGGHTATLLPNGMVLAVGGMGPTGASASSEIYEPATGTWTTTGSLSAARRFHTATLLPNGTVLVAGGATDGGGALRTAEIFDPATEIWSPTGDMMTARPDGATATLLPNGLVLVAGGQYVITSPTAELYNPATGTWSPTGAMVVPRIEHTATLLSDGQVLVAGGDSYAVGTIAQSERYDPATGSWAPAGLLRELPNGAVRGETTHRARPGRRRLVHPTRDPAGRCRGSYDPWTNAWTSTGPMTSARCGSAATLMPSGRVLVSGGIHCGWAHPLTSAELFVPPPPPNRSRTAAAAVRRR